MPHSSNKNPTRIKHAFLHSVTFRNNFLMTVGHKLRSLVAGSCCSDHFCIASLLKTPSENHSQKGVHLQEKTCSWGKAYLICGALSIHKPSCQDLCPSTTLPPAQKTHTQSRTGSYSTVHRGKQDKGWVVDALLDKHSSTRSTTKVEDEQLFHLPGH